MESCNSQLHVAIVGAGIGGLTCAIACRQSVPPLQVTLLERVPEIQTIGAGIHIPPNAARALQRMGLLEKLKQAGGYEVEGFVLRRWEDGEPIVEKPLKGRVQAEYGAEWIATHRGDYQSVLLDEAILCGVDILTSADVVNISSTVDDAQTIHLKDGRQISADAVVGADGLWSLVRSIVLQRPFEPSETGDLAYRMTFSRDQLASIQSDRLNVLLNHSSIQVWMGPGRHAVFYPLRDHTEYNLVLIVADDLAYGIRMASGNLQEMAANFDGWDPILNDIISCSDTALKWKLLHFEALDQWVRGTMALLGDACHPTLPYQGQGAAMAVEDGTILGLLLSKLQNSGLSANQPEKNVQIAEVLRAYEGLRTTRTRTNVKGAVKTRDFYHLIDGDSQQRRDEELRRLPSQRWYGSCSFNWGDASYQKDLLGFDVLADAESRVTLQLAGLVARTSTTKL